MVEEIILCVGRSVMSIKISEKDETALRFRLGARVECNVGSWKPGTVVKLFYVQNSLPEGTCVPYQVKLDDGKLIFAPADVDRVIRQLFDEQDSIEAGTDEFIEVGDTQNAHSDNDFDALAERALALGLRTEAQIDLMTDGIAEGTRSVADAASELRGLQPVAEMPAAQIAVELSRRTASRLDGMEEKRHSFFLGMLEETMRATGFEAPAREWLPSERGCIESDWEGLPARALFLAVRDGRIGELTTLLGADASRVDDLDGDSLGLLHHVAFSTRIDPAAIEVIIKHGGSTELKTKHDETPLILAACYRNLAAAELLLQHDARADATDCHGHTALARATERSPFEGTARCGSAAAGQKKLTELLRAAAEAQKTEIGTGGRYRAAEAEGHRRRGNEAFVRGDYQAAIDAYTASIGAHEGANAYCNRAACWLKLGHARYVERRTTHGLFHQLCDGEAKVVRWCPQSCGHTSPSDYWPFCNGDCANTPSLAYKCRTVEICTNTVADLYRSAVSDAARAKTLEPKNEKAHYRQAKANLGLRDFPRAVHCLYEGLRHCPESATLKALLDKVESIADGHDLTRMSNPLATGHDDFVRRGNAAMQSASAMILCAFCTAAIAHARPVCDGLEQAALDGLGRRPPFAHRQAKPNAKAKALRAAGFPRRCPHCACDPCADIDQKAIRDLIDET